MTLFKKMIYATLALAVVALVLAFLGYRAIFSSNTKLSEPYELYLSSGSSYDDVRSQLVSDGVISQSNTFDIVAQLMKYNRPEVRSGRYIIEPGMSNKQIIQKLRAGLQDPVNVTFSTARYVSDIAGQASRLIEPDSLALLNALMDSSFLMTNELTPETAMTIIIPNTYQMYWNTTPEGFRERMLNEYKKYWAARNREEKRDALNMTQAEVITLASIVEKETNLKSERPTISGVYLNRLQQGIPLQADPTVVYALGDFTIRRVLNRHLEYDSPYNTYKYPGLPPGPIYMPSQSSIDAVLNAEQHDYIFFCAKPGYDGAHSFAKTNAQHMRNARAYHKWLTQQGIMQ